MNKKNVAVLWKMPESRGNRLSIFGKDTPLLKQKFYSGEAAQACIYQNKTGSLTVTLAE
jgi:hypothetical protein